jgi:hypothetical protein
MFRSIRSPIAAVAIGVSVATTACAQGWGWLDWGGWASTPDASLAQGMGHFYHGAGISNQQTAIADSINADTTMRWNDYLHQVHTESLRRYVARRNESSARNRAARAAILTRLRDNPEVRDIEMGDALNVAVNQLTDPKISSSALRLANAPITANVIQEIAFRNAAYAVTIVLSQIRSVTKWPAALDTPRFAAEKVEFEAIVERAIKEDDEGEGEVTSATLKRAHNLADGLRAKLAAEPLEGNRAREEATRFVKTFAGVIRLLERADTTDAFNQLRKVESTTLAHLLAFMEIYNLRFGAATTPRQKAVYRELFAKIDAVRDQVVKQVRAEENGSFLSNLQPVFDFFGSLFRW